MGQNQAPQSPRVLKRDLGCQQEEQLVEESRLGEQCFKLQSLIQKLLTHEP